MTKYSKIKKSSFAILALSLILVAVLAFGGTYAYFSATSSTGTGSATLGTLSLEMKYNSVAVTTDTFKATGTVVPNQRILDGSKLTLDMTSTDINVYVRIKFNVTVAAADDAAEHKASCGEPADAEVVSITGIDLAKWQKHVDGSDVYYYFATAATAATKTNTAPTFQPTVIINKLVGNNGCAHFMGATVNVAVQAEAIQADYLASSTEEGTAMSVSDLHTAWAKVVDGTYGA